MEHCDNDGQSSGFEEEEGFNLIALSMSKESSLTTSFDLSKTTLLDFG